MLFSYLALLAVLACVGGGMYFLKRSQRYALKPPVAIAIAFFAFAIAVLVFVQKNLPVDNIYAIVAAASIFIAIRIGMRFLK